MKRRVEGEVPYLLGAYVVDERIEGREGFPFELPFVKGMELELDPKITFFVGENGSGKSTLMEALAELSGYPSTGGGKNEIADAKAKAAELAGVMRPRFRRRPRDGFFFRGETTYEFAGLLDRRREDPDFLGDPYARYGGRSLHTRSHGEAYLAVLGRRIGAGLYFLDEPEAALSPKRQLELLKLLDLRVATGKTQLVIATHSPILLTFPGARIVSFDDARLPTIALEETEQWRVTRTIVGDRAAFFREVERTRAERARAEVDEDDHDDQDDDD